MNDPRAMELWLRSRINSDRLNIRGNIKTLREELDTLERKLGDDGVLPVPTSPSNARDIAATAGRIVEWTQDMAVRLDVLAAVMNERDNAELAEEVAEPMTPRKVSERLTAAHIERGDVVNFGGSDCLVTLVEKLPNRPVIRMYLSYASNGKPIASKYTLTSPNKLWVVSKLVQT